MKTKLTLIVATLFACTSTIIAQKKYEKIMYDDVSVETEGVKILAKGAVSEKDMTKFNLKITNNSDDYLLLYKPEESTLKANGKEFKPKEKWLEIPPIETEHKVINFEGTDFLIPSYVYELDGIYKVSVNNQAIPTPDFQLPASINEFKTGNFACALLDYKKETDKTTVKFDCHYTGDKIGIVNLGNAAMKLPDGTEIANAKTIKAPIVLTKGENKKITLTWNRVEEGKNTDMQKIKLFIVWRNTFVESDAVKVKPATLEFKIDEAKSK